MFSQILLCTLLILWIAGGQTILAVNCPKELVKCHCYYYKPGHLGVTCEKKKLLYIPSGIPNTTEELYLGFNLLDAIPSNSFKQLTNLKILSLKSNLISNIEDGGFNGLENLTSLFLTKNRIRVLGQIVFQPLSALKHLYLTQNRIERIPDVGNASHLIKFNIDNNRLKNASFPLNFQRLKELKSVTLSNNPGIHSIAKEDFAALSGNGVTKMDLSRCGITYIENGSFANFPYLTSLVLSYNNIPSKDAKGVIDGLHGSKITALDLSSVFVDDVLENNTFDGLDGVPLLQLFLRHSSISVLKGGTFRKLRTLKLLDLSFSRIIRTQNDTFKGLDSLEKLLLYHNSFIMLPTNLPKSCLYIDISHNPSVTEIHSGVFNNLDKLQNLFIHHCGIAKVANEAFDRNINLNVFDLSHNAIGGKNLGSKVFSSMINLEKLDLSYNKLSIFQPDANIFSPLTNLQNLSLSHNDCQNLSFSCFSTLKNLKNLDLSNNNLGKKIAGDQEGSLFKSLRKLFSIDLSFNNIAFIPARIFQNLGQLKYLRLDDNVISKWNPEVFRKLLSLDTLNLAGNSISIINQSSFSFIEFNIQRINLSSNPFSCYCGLVWFRNWVNKTNITFDELDSYKCSSPRSMLGKRLLDFDPKTIAKECRPPPWILVVVGVGVGAFLIALINGFIMYRNRWKIRLWMYRRKKAWIKDTTRDALVQPTWDYDCFISASDDQGDKDWVLNTLLPKMYNGEIFEGRDMNGLEFHGEFNLIYEDTHFKPEEATICQMTEGIEKSERVMIVLSKHYLREKKKIDFELMLALEKIKETGLRSIILVILEPGTDVRLPQGRLHDILEKGDQLQWKEDNEHGKELFWRSLEDRLREQLPYNDNEI